ncbi:DUF3060 domain-containing protein [Mycolicibacterium sp. F2034L]|uniref:DUF3060 domain-containing protein n=1 Tax=Mycolicibacterium sp. F2034L TaxID=2926422 RepID=UPI001FF32B7D|nr:DUF3060 domain-containing protein [Mycolicibacterium sp. F2034L]MCK0173829.1 DUF3060 domain-containing protein [Mycolicibacterium sp. F2034L]
MNPQDDPEARIRDLERPLADRARTSELGTQPYSVGGTYPSPPPPLPPPAYDTSYPVAYPAPKSSHTSVVVLVIVVLTLLVVGAGVAIYFANGPRDSATTAGRPVVGGGGPIDLPPEVLPTGGPPVVVFPDVPDFPGSGTGGVVQAPVNGTYSVSGVRNDKRIVCHDSMISVSGVSNQVTITGHCASVTVSGVENMVTVEDSAAISASGFDNRVFFKTGDPEINASGDNVVERG